MGTAIQIGTFKGNDAFQKEVQKNQYDKVILIEPLSQHNGDIHNNYSKFNNYELLNLVVTDNKSGFTEFFYLDWHTDLSSILQKERHNSKIILPCISINMLLDTYSNCDLLWMDTESYDYNLIQNLDLNKYRPKKIVFEVLLSSRGGGKVISNPDLFENNEFEHQTLLKLMHFGYKVSIVIDHDQMTNFVAEIND